MSTKYRHEWKHVINEADVLSIRSRVRAVCRLDPNTVDGKYIIRSLYFDTPDDRALKEKVNGVDRRENFRQPGPFGGGPAMPDLDFSKVDWDKLDPTDLGLPEDFDLSSVDWDAIDMQALMSGSFDPTEVGLPEGFSMQNIDQSVMSSLFEAMGGAEGAGGPGGEGKGGPGGSSSDVMLQYTDDDPDSYSNIFDSAKTAVSDEDRQRLIASLKQLGEFEDLDEVLDTDEVMRYLVVHNFTVNGDSYTGAMIHNYYLYEEYGKLHMIPWDYNLAFGGFQGNDATAAVNDDVDAPLSVTGDGSRPMADWVYQTEEDKAKYHEYFAEFLEQVDILGILDEAYELIQPYVEKDPTKFCTSEEFETAVKTLREFCELRIESVQNQLAGDDTEVDASSIDLSDMGSMGMGGGMPGSGSDTSQGFPGTPPAEWSGGEMPQSPEKSERKTKSTTSASAKTAA